MSIMQWVTSSSPSKKKQTTPSATSSSSTAGLEAIHRDYDEPFSASAAAANVIVIDGDEDEDAEAENAQEAVSAAIAHLLAQHSESAKTFAGKTGSLSLLKQTADGLLDTYVYGDTLPLSAGKLSLSFSSAEGALHRLSLPAATHSFVKSTRTIKASYREEADFDVFLKPEVQALLAAAEESPFGRQRETVRDPSVRRAKHIPAERITEIEGFDVQDIVDQVRTILFPREAHVVAKLLKLNIYQEGDFFKPHQDTPLSADSLGSLVVALPVAHRGGQLEVWHRDEEETFDFARELCPTAKSYYFSGETEKELEKGSYGIRPDGEGYSSYSDTAAQKEAKKRVDSNKLKCGVTLPVISYAAFYGNCVHEIKPVTGGMRLTLSYQLLRGHGERDGEQVKDEPVTEAVKEEAKEKREAEMKKDDSSAEAKEETKKEEVRTMTLEEKEDVLKKKTIPELKDLCKQLGLHISGTKGVLLQRLLDCDRLVMQMSSSGGQPAPVYPPVDADSASVRANLFRLALLQALANGDVDDSSVGFPCYHLYEGEEDLPKIEGFKGLKLTAKDLKRLRGADALLTMVAVNAGFKVSLLRIVYVYDGGDGCTTITKILPSKNNVSKLMTKKVRIEDSFMARGIDLEDFPLEKDEHYDLESIDWVRSYEDQDKVPRKELLDAWVSGTGYFGNEAGQGTVYSQCAIVIDFPASDSKAKVEIAERLLSEPVVVDSVKTIPNGKRME